MAATFHSPGRGYGHCSVIPAAAGLEPEGPEDPFYLCQFVVLHPGQARTALEVIRVRGTWQRKDMAAAQWCEMPTAPMLSVSTFHAGVCRVQGSSEGCCGGSINQAGAELTSFDLAAVGRAL